MLVKQLADVVGGSHVLTDSSLVESYSRDWTGTHHGRPLCVVRPGNTAEVVAVVRSCAEFGTPVTIQGGNTSLVAGAAPSDHSVLLSMRRLDFCGSIDVEAGQVTVGAGLTLAALQQASSTVGLDFGVDLAARDSATIGGMVATNAGGLRVCRYGSMDRQLVGAEVVLADGAVVSRLDGLPKQSAGLDLTGLFAGSEGILGVLTMARLKLVPAMPATAVAVVAVADTSAAVALLPRMRATLASLSAVELFYSDGLDLVREHHRVRPPFAAGYPVYLLVECRDREDPTQALVTALAEAPGVLDVALASDPVGVRNLWAIRELHTESVSAEGIPLKLDVGVPVGRLSELVDSLPDLIAVPGARVITFGHLNEGNLHINVLEVEGQEIEVTRRVLEAVVALGGTVSAEHGIGRAKTPWLALSRSREDIATMTSIKKALDPAGLFNPGVLLPRGAN